MWNDEDKLHDKPDNCAICHVVIGSSKFRSSSKFQASGKAR